jgi:transposase-like protein
MSGQRYSVELKLEAVGRLASGESPSKVATDLKVDRRRVYEWHWQYQEGGAEALRRPGRPRKEEAQTARGQSWRGGGGELAAAQRQIAELQRKVGEQQVDLDFFRAALRRVQEMRQSAPVGVARPSTKSSKR